MTQGFAHSAARGVYFTMIAQAVKIILQLLSVIVLARLLTPHDYGLLALVLVVVGFGEIFRDFGLTSASIQAPTLSRGQRDNLFWINAAIGIGLAALTFLAAWPAASITGERDLFGMVQWLALLFVLNGLATQYRANLTRALRFKWLALVDIAAATIALTVAIVAALGGAGFWALVAQQLTSAAVVMCGTVIGGRWLPKWYSRKHPVRGIVTFGWNIVATNVLVYAGSQVDTVLTGMKYGTSALGVYNRSYQLVMTPLSQVRSPLQGVIMPVLARVQDQRARFNVAVTSAQLAMGYAFGVPLAVVAGVAAPLVVLALGDQWMEAIDIVRLFAAAGICTTLSYVGYWIYVSRGLSKQLFRYTVLSTSIKIISIAIGAQFGLIGVAIGFAVHPAIAWPISLFWLSRITPVPTRQLYEGAFRVIAVCVLVCAGSWLVSWASTPFGQLPALLIGAISGIILGAAALVLPRYRTDARTLTTFARLMLRREA